MVTTRSGGAKTTTAQPSESRPKQSAKRKKTPTRGVEQLPNFLESAQHYTQGLQEKSESILLLPQETVVNLSLWDTFEISKLSKQLCEDGDSSRLHLCYAGGEVWACDTLKVESKLYLALNAYRKDSLVHSIYEKYSKPGLIQIWEYDISGLEKPVCILCIGHEGDFCRQLRWLPLPPEDMDSENQHILGYLLGCFGDGTLKVLRVTYDPLWKQKFHNEPILVSSDILFCFASPCDANLVVAECSSDGRWIIGGDTKGSLHMWNLTQGNLASVLTHQQSSNIYYQSFPAHPVTIRSLASPRTHKETTNILKNISVPCNELIASGSMDGCIRIWNIHYPYRPLLEYRLGQSWIYQLEWHSSKELVAALDDGSVRLLPIEDSTKSTRVLALHRGACWCLSISTQDDMWGKSSNFTISSGGENGEWIYCNERLFTSRKNKKRLCHPWILAKVEIDSSYPKQASNDSIRYTLSTFIGSSANNVPATTQYIQRPLSTGTCIPFPPSIAFHRVFHYFMPTTVKDTHSMFLGATFGSGWFLLGTMSSWLVQQQL